MKHSRIALVLLAAASWGATNIQAGTYFFHTYQNQFDAGVNNQGWWSLDLNATDDNDNYYVGENYISIFSGSDYLRNFFTFSLTGLDTWGQNVTSSTLHLFGGESSAGDATETFVLYDVSTDAATLNNNVGLATTAIWNDLGGGTSYGSFTLTRASVPFNTVSLSLNSAALADIASQAGNYFSIGGALTSDGGAYDQYLFGSSEGYYNTLVVGTTVYRVRWQSSLGGKWETASSWYAAYRPDATLQEVQLTNATTKTVTIDTTTAGSYPSSMTVSNLTIAGPAGTVNTLAVTNVGLSTPFQVLNTMTISTGGALMVSNSAVVIDSGAAGGSYGDGLVVGRNGAGNLVINGGSISVNALIVTNGLNSVFTFNSGTVVSRGTSVSNFSAFVIGDTGSGGATFIANGGTHRMTNNLYVGNTAGNTLIVSNAAFVQNADGFIGNAWGSNNLAIVTGTGSIWSNRLDFVVGEFGAGNQLTVKDGGTLFNRIGYLGLDTSSCSNLVVVTGNNARWDNRTDLHIGRSGDTNALNIGAGGSVIASNAYVGFNAGADGNRINVSGGNLYVTNALGTGTLDIRRGTLTFDGGVVTADRLFLTNGLSSAMVFNSGVMSVKTSQVANGSALVVGDGTSPATLKLLGGGHVFQDGLILAAASRWEGTGTVAGVVNSAGTIAPGFSAGQLNITGNLTQQLSSVLSLEIGGTTPGTEFDFLSITGSGMLTGRLDVALINAFTPTASMLFTTVSASVSLAGDFTNLVAGRVSTLGNEGSFAVNWMPGSGYLVLGDFQFNELSAVPEPSTLLLLGVGGALAYRLHRRRRGGVAAAVPAVDTEANAAGTGATPRTRVRRYRRSASQVHLGESHEG